MRFARRTRRRVIILTTVVVIKGVKYAQEKDDEGEIINCKIEKDSNGVEHYTSGDGTVKTI